MKLRTALLASALAALPAARAAAAPSMLTVSSAAFDTAAVDDKAAAVAVDAAGNVYIAGTTGNDLLAQKYSKALVLSPSAQAVYTNGRSGNKANGIALDGLGNVLVAAEEVNAALNLDFLLLKYNSSFSTLLSSAVFDGGSFDEAEAVGTDSQNNVFVTGYLNDAGNKNVYTLKYSPALAVLSTAAFDATGTSDQATAIALDDNDNVIVAGYTLGATNNVLVIKYDNNLNKLRDVTFDAGGDERAVGVAVDSSGNIIVSARKTSGVTQALTLKYDNSLTTLLSSAVYNSELVTSTYTPTAVAVDSADNIVIAGFSGTASAAQLFALKYDSAFNVISTAAYSAGLSDQANAAAVDSEDNIVLAGQSNDGASFEYFAVKYSASPRLTDVTALYIGETANVTLTGRGLLADTAVAFADAGISTGASSYNSGQITIAVTPSTSVILGVTTVTVTNSNGEYYTTAALARTRLRHTLTAGSGAAISAMTGLGSISLTIQAGSFANQETLTLAPAAAAAGDIQQVGEALNITGFSTTTAMQAMTITLRYAPAALGTYPEGSLSLAYYDASSATGWVTLPSGVDTSAKTVTATTALQVNTKYAVVKAVNTGGGGGGGIGGPGGGSGIPAKVYPNPYRPGSGGNFDDSAMGEGIVFAGLGAGQAFKLTIVDVAGRLVLQKSGTADADGKFLWDTKTASGGKATTGVYIYHIKGGGEPLKGKFAVIR